jgi:NitT/TauT family transport system substrate-binding protein
LPFTKAKSLEAATIAMKRSTPVIQVVIPLLLTLALAACAGQGTPETGGAEGASSAEAASLTVQLAWVPTIEYAPFYVADADGYFAGENLTVDLRAGGFDAEGSFIDHVGELLNGNADIALMSGDRLLVERANGAPLVAIGAVYQRSPIAFISLADASITSPQDFMGAKVQVDAVSGSTGIAYIAMMEELGIDRSQINEVPREDFSNTPLTSGQVDVISAFVNNQPVQLEGEGYDLNIILASDYGIDIYPNVIVTTEAYLNSHRDVLVRFMRATAQGLSDAIANPQHAAEVTLAVDPSLNLASETESMLRALPLLDIPGNNPGSMTDASWERAYEILSEQGLLGDGFDVRDVYTLDILNEVYSQ